TVVAVLKPDHVRDVDLFVRRYGARAFGPFLFWRHDIPDTQLERVEPGTELPGGLVALYDGRGRSETPMWLPEQRVVVFADALTVPIGFGPRLPQSTISTLLPVLPGGRHQQLVECHSPSSRCRPASRSRASLVRGSSSLSSRERTRSACGMS